jgi:hypothetical protein
MSWFRRAYPSPEQRAKKIKELQTRANKFRKNVRLWEEEELEHIQKKQEQDCNEAMERQDKKLQLEQKIRRFSCFQFLIWSQNYLACTA